MAEVNRLEYFDRLRRAIELEREEEKRAALEEIKRLSGEKRERLGRAVLNLRGSFQGRDIGGYYVVKFGRAKPFETEIDVGDVVLVSRGDPLKSDLTGTVVAKTSRSLSVAFDDPPPKWTLKKGIRIDLYFNDVTFKRMERAIDKMESGRETSWIREIVLGKRKPLEPKIVEVDFFDDGLNEFQRRAAERALGAEVFLIHGPPGTGKTRTLTEVIVQLVRMGKRVAASADSNTAADNLLENLVKRGVKAVRIGHPARVEKELVTHTLSYTVQSDPEYGRVEELMNEAQRLIEERDSFTRPEPKYRRGLSDEEILRLAEKGKGSRGVPPRLISSMAAWIRKNLQISKLMDEAKKLEEAILKRKLVEAEVVVGTNSSFGMDFMEDERFDCLVHDEATQSTEPSSYIPLVLSRCLIMAGDHKQLPPTVMNLEAQKILSKTLFEKFIERFEGVSEILRVQYRMNERIMEFSSRVFYDGKLIAHESVRNRTLSKLGYSMKDGLNFPLVVHPDVSLALIDTSHHPGKWERQRRGSTSRENELEATLVKKVVEDLSKIGLPTSEIGVITPYDDQVDLLKRILPGEIKVSTVDAFQGKEKEVIVISFVRSNRNGDLGFLEDLRRLNVSITRARSKLILIGDFSTLSAHPVYRDLRSYVSRFGRVEIIR